MTLNIKIPVAWSILAACTLVCSAQTALPFGGMEEDSSYNQTVIQTAKADKGNAGKADRKVVVFTGDTIVPHVVDGGGWRTSFTFVNLENRTVRFQLLFLNDSGKDLYLSVAGQGSVRGLQITLPATATITLETQGLGALSGGWAYIVLDNPEDSIGGFAVFRQSVPGRPDLEAVVPIVNQFDGHFVLLFDNVGFTTATALANPTANSVSIPVVIRSESGAVLEQQTLRLGPFSHSAFTVPDIFASTKNRRGSIEFLASGFGVGALGLRFGAASFTSFHVLSNFDWR